MTSASTHPHDAPDATVDYAYRHIMLAVDNSALSNRGIELGIELARVFGAELTGTHAYAAKLHDLRFRQMEGGLPEKYRREQELERQREVHDTLITQGLELISDSYLDVVEDRARDVGLKVGRKALEGKNYRALLSDIAANDYDLVVLGAFGLGAVESSVIGSVCERVVRGTDRDVLVVKERERNLRKGRIVVAIDGSPKSYGGLMIALKLARELEAEVEAVAAFDPYFHYVAFNSIADVLSEEAGEVFRFEEQEQLHEEIIDSGLAKIYQGHLAVAEKIAAAAGVELETTLLAGKPYDTILKHLRAKNPALLVLGRTGIHADEQLQIGSNAENLVRLAPCNILLTDREHMPDPEEVAEETTSWTEEAEQRMDRVPSFVRNMARTAIHRYAQERGHTVISSDIVDAAIADLLPASAMERMGMLTEAAEKRRRKRDAQRADADPDDQTETTFDGRSVRFDAEAQAALAAIPDEAARENVRLRTVKHALVSKRNVISVELVREITGEPTTDHAESPAAAIEWDPEALDRLARVPEGFMRDRSRASIEQYVRDEGKAVITLDLCEAGLARAREAMAGAMSGGARAAPHAHGGAPSNAAKTTTEIPWDDDAAERLGGVPEAFRDLVRQRVEVMAGQLGLTRVTLDVVGKKYDDWADGSAKQGMSLPWNHDALERVMRIPSFVRGMVIQEVEHCARARDADTVTPDILEQATEVWRNRGQFHSEAAPDLYDSDD